MFSRILRILHPSHQHSAFSATVLLMSTVMLSRVIGYLREAYIAYAFGAGGQTDAYVAAFTLPDWLNYILAGGTASITFISIYTRFLAQKQIFTPQFVGWMFHGFSAEQMALCVSLTRILLPAQIFFYVGGVVGAVLLSHRMFLFPSFGPLIYNLFIILGGIIAGKQLGIASLAWGALAGTIIGPFLVNAFGAARIGTRYRPAFDLKNAAFREWVRLSIPLMLGVSLVTADDWILRYFASSGVGDIARLNYAKRLFAVPIAVLGQATGQASLPFFARLFGEKRMKEFGETVNGSVYRISALSFLCSALMMVAALPLIDLVYRRGRFSFGDSQETALYFFWFSISLAFWAAQGLYARAFYAAGDTLTPMVACTLVTLASLAVYRALFHSMSVVGLAIASDIGIIANTIAAALLLHRRKLVSLGDLPWVELGKATLVAAIAGALAWQVSHLIPLRGSRTADLESLGLSSITWAGAVAAGLWLLRSDLPQSLRRKKAMEPVPVTVEAKVQLEP
ncbi:MAG: virulence factor MviN [Acidobacteria bacterium]|nr:MAG: virulence factor MviN [Acidobacteriota bacterium]